MPDNSTPRRPMQPDPGWGTLTGRVTLRRAAEWELVSPTLLPEAQQCIHRYAWAIDDHREDLLRECFTEDAVWEASVIDETRVGPFEGRDAVLEWSTRFWRYQRDQRRHVFTNVIVDDQDGDEVTAYAYMNLVGSRRLASKFETIGFVRFALRRVGRRLAIRHFAAGFDAPFWSMPVEEMTPELIELFGVTEHRSRV